MDNPSWFARLTLPALSVRRTKYHPGRLVEYSIKRGLDYSGALLLIILLSPLMLAIFAFVRASDGGLAIFRQRRIGRGGRPFSCLKFRTMVPNADSMLRDYLARTPEAAREWQASQKLKSDPRITPIGAFLRKSSLDELPQLFNILAGEMSFVGPRPIVADEIARYGDSFSHCFSVLPGLTGMWQVSGRSDCSYGARVALDSGYVSDWGLLLDVKIVLLTVPAVLKQSGSR